MKQQTYRILHFRFLNGRSNYPVSMQDYRYLRNEVLDANAILEYDSSNSLRFPLPELSPYGGYTVAILTDNDTGQSWLGVAKCNTSEFKDEDGKVQRERFVRKDGVAQAINAVQTARNENSDPTAFITDSTDRKVFEYLRDNELLEDNVVDQYNGLREAARTLKLQKREKSLEYTERQATHEKHLQDQAVRAAEWHRTHP